MEASGHPFMWGMVIDKHKAFVRQPRHTVEPFAKVSVGCVSDATNHVVPVAPPSCDYEPTTSPLTTEKLLEPLNLVIHTSDIVESM